MIIDNLTSNAIALLQQLISIESYSKTENKTADVIEQFLNNKNIPTQRLLNNVWAKNKFYDNTKPTILLNSHHDTVKPNSNYTYNPFDPIIKEGKLYGLGSNDAGGALVSLMVTFIYYYNNPNLQYNLIFAASAEEENSGANGIEKILPAIGPIDFGIVGEPTLMQMAVAEKGLMVLDCVAYGIAGHAAREEGDNAIYKAIQDINWFNSYTFNKVSPTLGAIKMSVTIINAGTQHNVVPNECSFTVDVRITDAYTNKEVLEIIQQNVACKVTPRSLRLNSSSIAIEHPLVQSGINLGSTYYGSPTTSDQALMPFTTLKMGPGDSARSHTANEYIYINEIEQGIAMYIALLENILL
jgi:acetylornithine deacetylase